MLWQDLATAVCLVFVLEGLLPFVAPARWKDAMRQMAAVEDATLRVVGLLSMLGGVGLLYLVRAGA